MNWEITQYERKSSMGVNMPLKYYHPIGTPMYMHRNSKASSPARSFNEQTPASIRDVEMAPLRSRTEGFDSFGDHFDNNYRKGTERSGKQGEYCQTGV